MREPDPTGLDGHRMTGDGVNERPAGKAVRLDGVPSFSLPPQETRLHPPVELSKSSVQLPRHGTARYGTPRHGAVMQLT